MRKWVWVVVVGALLIALPGTVLAYNVPGAMNVTDQDGAGAVGYDAPAEGSITNATPFEEWTFAPGGADRIRVTVERTSGNLIPDVWIIDSNRQDVTRSYGADETQAVAEISDYTLPFEGPFTVVVSRLDEIDGDTTGDYRLTVTALGTAPEQTINTEPLGEITFDAPVSGTISPEHWRHVYTFQGLADDYIRLSARRLNGTLAPEIVLLDSNEQEIQRGYSDGNRLEAVTDVYLPYSGEYQIVVQRESQMNGETTGDYELAISLRGSAPDSERLTSREPGVIAQYDVAVHGEVTDALWYEDWQFMTQAGDTVTIDAERAPGYAADTPNNLEPNVALFDENGNQLAWVYGNGTRDGALDERQTLPGSGTYTVRVFRSGEQDGTTTGTYDLTVYLIGSGEGSPNLDGDEGTLTAGTPVQGALDTVRWADQWTFEGKESDQIVLTAQRTDGTLIPRLSLLDAAGNELWNGYPEPSGDVVTLDNWRLPADGTYTVRVFRDREQEGYTTGGYELLLETIAAQ